MDFDSLKAKLAHAATKPKTAAVHIAFRRPKHRFKGTVSIQPKSALPIQRALRQCQTGRAGVALLTFLTRPVHWSHMGLGRAPSQHAAGMHYLILLAEQTLEE